MTTQYINEFIDTVHRRYPYLHIDYEYNEDEEEFTIWHNSKEYEFTDNIFKKFIAKTAGKTLFSRGVYNFSFGYDHYKTKAMEEEVK